MTSTTVGGRIQGILAPDRPSEVYRASLGPPQLMLAGTTATTCSVVLRREH